MKKRILFGAAIAAALFGSAAYAGGLWPTLPQATQLTGSENIPADTGLPNGAYPQTEYLSLQQIGSIFMQQSSPLTGTTIVAANATQLVDVTPAGTLAALTIDLPVAPVNGQVFGVFSSQILTSLTLTAASGQTIVGNSTTLIGAVNTHVEFVYQASNSTWYRSK